MRNLEDAKKVSNAVVFKNGRAAASLVRSAGTGVVFSYLPKYLSDGGRAIASTLPAVNVPVSLGPGAVPAFFSGLLPEGERLAKLRWAVKTTLSDEFSLLLAAGANPVGDVQIVPMGSRPEAVPPLVQLKKRTEEISFADYAAVPGPVDHSALPGRQDKVTAGYLGPKDPWKAYILKFNDARHQHQVQMEYLLLAKAKKLGIDVVDARIVHDAVGQSALMVSRFDRSPTGPRATEDAAQLLGLPPTRKASVSGESVAAALISRCSAQLLAARNVFLQFLFAWLSGNGNLHAKNLAVVQGASGEWRLAPAYDLQCTLAGEIERGLAAGVPGGIVTDLTDGDPTRDPGMALAIGGNTGSRSDLTRDDWLRFARGLHLPNRLASGCIDKALRASALTAAELPFERQVSHGVVRVLEIRRGKMAG